MTGNQEKAAFTLAEVLITLGIIGVVAAMTMPSLVQHYTNQVVETRLQKFYSTINQAVRMAEVDYGDKKIWWQDLAGAELDSDENVIEGTSESEKWFNKYLTPYLKITKKETLSDGTFIVYFPDGSALRQAQQNTTRDWVYYPNNVKKCIEQSTQDTLGICSFAFNFKPSSTSTNWTYHYNKGFEPFKYVWNGDIDMLLTDSTYGCSTTTNPSILNRAYCTALIQNNGWKIPEDYPFKVK